VKFRFITAAKAHHLLTLLCRGLRVTRTGFTLSDIEVFYNQRRRHSTLGQIS